MLKIYVDNLLIIVCLSYKGLGIKIFFCIVCINFSYFIDDSYNNVRVYYYIFWLYFWIY